MTKIEWTNATWNPVVGCTPVSPGCANCYAARMASRFPDLFGGVALGRKWTGTLLPMHERLEHPLRWRKPRRVFVCSMSDLFHKAVLFEFIDRVFAVMALCPQHQFQVLTKRPERMAEYLERGGDGIWSAACDIDIDEVRPETDPGWPLPNVWLGTSCENQATADERIPHLLRCPAVVRFISCEPLLDEIDLSGYMSGPYVGLPGDTVHPNWNAGIDWVIVGGESGPNARSCYDDWITSIRDQCHAASVPVFIKQLGSNPIKADLGSLDGWPEDGSVVDWETGRIRLRHPKGGDPAEWPEDLRVRQCPEVTR